MNLLAADIGGTTCRLAWFAPENGTPHVHAERHYVSRDFADLTSLIERFLADVALARQTIAGITLALPGPLQEGAVILTNLGWRIELAALQQHFAPAPVTFINDFQATATGIDTLTESDLQVINPGQPSAGGLRVVTGAGTGLGLAWLPAGTGAAAICASEGGHIDFAPIDELQTALLVFLRARHGHVSYERILSGDGLLQAYLFLSQDQGLAEATRQTPLADSAAEVSRLAGAADEIAIQAVSLFIRVYAQWVGNLALLYRPAGGLYIAGGIAAKLARWLQTDDFLQHCYDKGRMRHLVEQTPIYLVTNERVGLQGAMNAALANTQQHARKHA